MEEGREDKEEVIGKRDPTFRSEVRPSNESICYSESLLGACITQPVLPASGPHNPWEAAAFLVPILQTGKTKTENSLSQGPTASRWWPWDLNLSNDPRACH